MLFRSAVSAGTSSCVWSVPNGITLVSGQGTSSIDIAINSGFNSKDSVSVQATNACGAASLLWFVFDLNLPPAPSSITGPTSALCGSSSVSYSVNAVSGTTYTWSFSGSGAAIVSGQGTPTILTSFAANAPANTLSVSAQNTCGSSTDRKSTRLNSSH